MGYIFLSLKDYKFMITAFIGRGKIYLLWHMKNFIKSITVSDMERGRQDDSHAIISDERELTCGNRTEFIVP